MTPLVLLVAGGCSPAHEDVSEEIAEQASSLEEGGPTVQADFHTRKTPPRAKGEFDVISLSSLPDAVTGGDVLIGLRGLSAADQYTVQRNGIDVTAAFKRGSDGEVRGLVTGLIVGNNRIEALATGPNGKRRAALGVVNYPITGPVISGPHQSPFLCQTRESGLGDPLDSDCSVETRYEWFYRTSGSSSTSPEFKPLANPYEAYPADVERIRTKDGRDVPFVVRVESSTINRGIARIAVLDDPHARGPQAPFDAAGWDHRVYYFFGALCGVGYHQGINTPGTVLGVASPGEPFDFGALLGVEDRLRQGDAIVHSTLSTFGVQCNALMGIESAMMVLEHITEKYGIIAATVGSGGSGAAIQQYNAINNAPGLLSGALPVATFVDVWTTYTTVADCGLLTHYYQTYAPSWDEAKKGAVEGHDPPRSEPRTGICQSWSIPPLQSILDPKNGCDPSVPYALRYDPVTNPHGARCTLQDANVNVVGRDPVTGFARRPIDNTGVQYGLDAFNRRRLSAAEFIDLNRRIGGFDIDGHFAPERMVMHPDTESMIYRTGQIIGRGALDETPVMDMGLYLDLIPLANIHDSVRPFSVRARLRRYSGLDAGQSIWRGASVTPPDAYQALARWLDVLDLMPYGIGPLDRARAVAYSKPFAAGDRCLIDTPHGRVQVPENFDSAIGPCSVFFPVSRTPRIAAGMPLTDDVLRCQRKPLDRRDYLAPLTDAEFAELRSIFPDGVCDYTKRAARDVDHSILWPTIGGETPHPPIGLTYRVARSVAVP
ncbi:DUF6351 family protein [Pendulispora rubella]|uniref:DUF6351 family protein n=1 Tax=Pendulispora rubella TaxID=2741070 RepID=A0ABZ2KR44_9BACT